MFTVAKSLSFDILGDRRRRDELRPDPRIFVLPVVEAVRIRTRDRGEDAI